jgi:hypothetical protein
MKRSISLTFKLIVALAAFAGVAWQIFSHDRIIEMLSYFTIQSNLIAAFLFSYLFYSELTNKTNPSWVHLVKGGVTVALLITFLVYHFVLRQAISEMESGYDVLGGADLFVHYIVPILVALDWVIFSDDYSLSKWLPLAVLAQPLLYLAYLGIYRVSGGLFFSFGQGSAVPYFFLDVENLGWGTVLLFCFGLSFVISVIGFLLLIIDQGKKRWEKKN